MRSWRIAFAAFLFLPIVACGATLTRGPTGWRESGSPYSVAPLESGELFPTGWTIDGYSVKEDGFRRITRQHNAPELELHRLEDDGVLIVAQYAVADDDRLKRPEVLADRWIDRVVQNPKGDDDTVLLFAPVVPRLESTARGAVGWQPVSSTVVYGRAVQIDQRGTFTVPAGEAAQVTATLAPVGSSADRRLYVAVVKQTGGERYVVVAYGNTPTMFDKGLADATSFAHRLHF